MKRGLHILAVGGLLGGFLCFTAKAAFVEDGSNLWEFVDGGLVRAGQLTVSDGFSTKDTNTWDHTGVSHLWAITSGCSLVTSDYGGSLPLRQTPSGGYVLDVKVKLVALDPAHGDGFTGIIASGIMLLLQPGRYWWQWRRPGEATSVGRWKEERIPLQAWYDLQFVRRPGGAFEWCVNGRRIFAMVEPEMTGGVSLLASGIKTAYRDFRLYSIDAPETNINMVSNGSFENYADNLPPYWKPTRFRDIPLTYGDVERFCRSWALDQTEKDDGGVSLRLSDGNGLLNAPWTAPLGDCVLSLSMKSALNGQPAVVSLAGVSTNCTVDVAWRRYAVAFSNASRSVSLRISPGTTNALWVDAVQLERGRVASPYRSNPCDLPDAVWVPSNQPPSVTIPFVAHGPVLDGAMTDAAWLSASPALPLRMPGNLPGNFADPPESAEARLCYDDHNLYVGVTCRDLHVAELRTAVTGNDDPWIDCDDSVEILLDVARCGKEFSRFAVNALGVRLDSKGVDDISWTTDWTAAVAIASNAWSVETAIPLADLGLGGLTGDLSGINICRNHPRTGSTSCTAPVFKSAGMYAYDAAHFAPVQWGNRDVLSAYRFELRQLAVTPCADDTNRMYLTGTVRNRSDADASLIVTAEVGGTSLTSAAFAVRHGEEHSFAVTGFMNATGVEADVHVDILDATTGKVLSQMSACAARLPLLNSVVERSYYTTETDATIRIATALREDLLPVSNLLCELHDGNDAIVWSARRSVTGAEEQVSVPLGGLPCGTFDAVVRALDGAERELGRGTATLRKLSSKPHEVKIDRIGRYLLADGNPIVPIAPLQVFSVSSGSAYGDYDAVIEAVIKYWADNGFTSLVVGANIDPVYGAWAERIWDQVFRSAAGHGVRVIAFWTGPAYTIYGDTNRVASLIDRWKDEPALLAWYPVDEPEINTGTSPEQVAAVVRFIQGRDPYHPVYVNYTEMGPGSRYAGLPGDIMSLDYYLTSVEGRTVSEALGMVDAMQEVSAPMNVPVWNFLDGGNLDNHWREPTAAEQVAQTYGNLVKGATGLKYFFGQLAGREHWRTLRSLAAEVAELTPAVCSGEEVAEVACANPDILVLTRRNKQGIYIVCVNVANVLYTVSLDLSVLAGCGYTGRTNVLFEGRYADVSGGMLTDVFEPYQRHVYEIEAHVKNDQAIAFPALPSHTYGDAGFLLSATAASGLPVSYESGNPAVAAVSGSVVTITGAGTAPIIASQPGDGAYYPAPGVTQILTVARAPLAIRANNKYRTVGQNNPVFDAVCTGLLCGDTATSIGLVATMNCPAVPGSPAGTYPIVPSGPESTANYAVTYQEGTLTVGESIMTTIVVVPANAGVEVGNSQQFAAVVMDQYGKACAEQPAFAWSVDGGGIIGSASGLFTATLAGGPHTVTATAEGISSTAKVMTAVLTGTLMHYVSPGGRDQWPYTNWTDAAGVIQDAVDAASAGDTVWVTAGVYGAGGVTNWPAGSNLRNRVAITKAITVRSFSGDPADTVIVGAWDPATTCGVAAVRCVYMGAGSTLMGFTITNGATMTTNNSATSDDYAAGGLYCSGGTVSNCVIAGNAAESGGGGAYQGTYYSCTFAGNRTMNDMAYPNGAGLNGGTAYSCTFIGNVGKQTGGTSAGCGGGGAYAANLYNCLLIGNMAAFGGAYVSAGNSKMYNCTVVGNLSAGWGGGVFGGSYVNCIIYSNSPNNAGTPGNSIYFTNSCCYTGTYGVATWVASTTNDPRFVSGGSGSGAAPLAGDYHLRLQSPCINAGTNGSWTTSGASAFDLEGHMRINEGIADMGCYEFPGMRGTVITFR